MHPLTRSVLTALSALSLCLAAPAQEYSGQLNVPYELTSGIETTISYSNPELGGGIIFISIDGEDGEHSEVIIGLDDDGYAEFEWMVPHWTWAIFSAPDAQPVRRWIDLGN